MSDNNFKIKHDSDGVSGFSWYDSGHMHDGKDPHVHELTKEDLSKMTLGDLDRLNDFRETAGYREFTEEERKEYKK